MRLGRTVELIPRKNILVGDDTFESADLFIKPYSTTEEVNISWKLLAKHFKTEGILKIKIEPEIEKSYHYTTVDEASQQRREFGDIEDFVEDKEK